MCYYESESKICSKTGVGTGKLIWLGGHLEKAVFSGGLYHLIQGVGNKFG